MKAVLIIEITYNSDTVTDGTAARINLRNAAQFLYSEGLLTQSGEMEIETVEDRVYIDYE